MKKLLVIMLMLVASPAWCYWDSRQLQYNIEKQQADTYRNLSVSQQQSLNYNINRMQNTYRPIRQYDSEVYKPSSGGYTTERPLYKLNY